MSKEKKEEEEYSEDDERQKLSELGVSNTWDLLSSEEKKRKENLKKNLSLEDFNSFGQKKT